MPLDQHAPYEHAGAATLAEQPVDPTKAPKKATDWSVIFAHLEARLGALRNWRYSWWAYWSELARFILPARYRWLVTANTMDRGNPINQDIIDGSPTQAMKVCAAGLLTGLMSPSRPWFSLGIGLPGFTPDAEAKTWLEDTSERINMVMQGSNFYQAWAQAFQDLATFGTAVVIIYEDFEDGIRCYVPCAGEYYLQTGARLSVDTMFREYTYTVGQIVEWASIDRCPDIIRKAWNTGGASIDVEHVVAHAVEPNFEIANRGGAKTQSVEVVPGSFPYREVYWLKGIKTEAELSRRGFHEKPFMVARWATTGNDAYGRGPGMDALGDVKQIQQETRRKAEFIEKGVRPPMGADPELKNEPASIMPGHMTYTDTTNGKKGFWPLFQVDARWVPALSADIKEIKQRVDVFFFTDVFMMISQMEGVQPRNELELIKREGEKIMRLGPMVADFETQCAGPSVIRVMNILERRRLLKPRPKSLQGLPVQITYSSILKMAQRAAETTVMEQALVIGAKASEAAHLAGQPSPMRNVNLDEYVRAYFELIGLPQRVLFSEDQVAQNDQAEEKKKQVAQALQLSMAGVGAAKDLGQANVGGGQSALGLMVNPSGQGGAAPGGAA